MLCGGVLAMRAACRMRAPGVMPRLWQSRSVVSGVGQQRYPWEKHATTILCVRKGDELVMIGDGQVTQGAVVAKPNARKIRRVGRTGDIIVGMAGSTADCFTLIQRLEKKLEEFPSQLTRACVELAKDWRTEKYLRYLEAVLLVADDTAMFEVTGHGDVIQPHGDLLAVGSGGSYAYAAARALMDQDLNAKDIAERAMTIAADMCVYTNHNFVVEELPQPSTDGDGASEDNLKTDAGEGKEEADQVEATEAAAASKARRSKRKPSSASKKKTTGDTASTAAEDSDSD